MFNYKRDSVLGSTHKDIFIVPADTLLRPVLSDIKCQAGSSFFFFKLAVSDYHSLVVASMQYSSSVKMLCNLFIEGSQFKFS